MTTPFGDRLRMAVASGSAVANPVGTTPETRRDDINQATLTEFEARFQGVPGADVELIHAGGLEVDRDAVTRQVVRVGSLYLVHSMQPFGRSLPENRRAVSSPNDLASGDPLMALDHFIQEKTNGLLAEATGTRFNLPPYNPNVPDNISDRYQKEAHNRRVDLAAARYNGWQVISLDQTDSQNPSLEFAAVLPSDPNADPAAVPTANDILKTVMEAQAQAASQGRSREFEYPLIGFTA